MAANERPMELIRAARMRLGNPYAFIEDLEEEAEARAAPLRSALHRSENPYASLAAWDGDDGDRQQKAPAQPLTLRPATIHEYLSKEDFRAEANRIFMSYVPPHLPRRLPQHQRDFIARNKTRSGKARHRIAQALRRYDLSTTPGIAQQFNREYKDHWDERKLRAIEAQVSDDD